MPQSTPKHTPGQFLIISAAINPIFRTVACFLACHIFSLCTQILPNLHKCTAGCDFKEAGWPTSCQLFANINLARKCCSTPRHGGVEHTGCIFYCVLTHLLFRAAVLCQPRHTQHDCKTTAARWAACARRNAQCKMNLMHMKNWKPSECTAEWLGASDISKAN